MRINRTIITAALPAALLLTTAPASAATRYVVSNGIAGVCLAAPLAGGYATGSPCPGGKDAPPLATELWTFPGRHIVSASGRCLQAGRRARRVRAAACRPIARQRWHLVTFADTGDATELRNGDGKCLDLPAAYFGRLRLTRCNNGDGTQNWFLRAA